MEEKNINPAESLEIINAMINTAKNKIADDGFLFIFWGWLVFIASLVTYFSNYIMFPNSAMVWNILLPLGAIVSLIYGYTQTKKKDGARTYIDIYLGYAWSAFIIAMVITLIFMGVHGLRASYFFLMILYGIATFVSGGLLNFKPLVYGSIFSFGFAIIAVFVGDNDQFLCLAAALLFSYIIPGHLLRAKFKSQVNV